MKQILLVGIGLVLFFIPQKGFTQNTNPNAADDYVSVCENSGVVNVVVQNNDTDPENNVLTTSIYSGPQNGSATLAGNTINYTPASNFFGNDTIVYVVCDNGSPSLCDTALVIISVTPLPVADAGPYQTICFGDSTQIGTPAVAGVTYSWSPSAGLSSSTVAQPNASPAATTTYYLLTTNSSTGCQNRDTVLITINPLPVANAGPDHTSCEYDSVMLGTPGTAGNAYYWSPIPPLNWNNLAQPMASPSSTTTFTLIVTTIATGCQSSDSVVVTINPAPPTNAGPDQTVCNGDSVLIGTPAIAGYTYSWSPAAGLNSATIAQPTASPSVTTTYTLTVTNSTTGCDDTDQVTVTLGAVTVANAGPDQSSCDGDSVMIGTPAVAGNTYSWSPASGLSSSTIAQPMASPLVTTTYTLTVTNSTSGCTSMDVVTVHVGISPVANAGSDQTICSGGSVMIGTPAIAGNSYSWSPALGLNSTTIAQPTASPALTTTYVLTVTQTTSGCQSTDSVIVIVNPVPFANAGPDQVSCDGDSVMIGTPAMGGITYSWSPATGLSSSTVAQPMAAPLTTTTYTLTISNTTTGCVNTDFVTVSIGTAPLANAGPDVNICSGDTIQLGTPPVAGNTYSWSPATGLSSSTVAQPMASPSATTTYTLTVTNAAGCSGTDAVTVSINPLPPADAGVDQNICPGGSVTIGTPAVGGNTYSWSPATGLSSSTVAQPIASPSVTTTYTVTVTNSTTSCTNTDAVVVNVYPTPVADAGPDQTICSGNSTQLGTPAISGNTYSWNPATGLSSPTAAQPNASPAATTTYILTVTSANGCTDADTVIVTVNPAPVANAGTGGTICLGESITIGAPAVSGHTYSWSPASGLSSSTAAQPTASPSVTTTYTVTETAGGCSGTATVTVTINIPTVDAGVDQVMCNGGTAVLGSPAISGYTYLWTPSSGLSSATVAQPSCNATVTTTYTLLVTDGATGCSASDEVVFTSGEGGEGGVFNAFSPNADGVNDWWRIPLAECFNENEVIIINRWGNEVWTGKNYNNTDVRWDGKNMKGENVTDGTYFYIIKYNDTEARGWVFVKR